MKKRLYRSTDNVMLAGVCSGLADFLGIDPTIVRLVWAVLALTAGTGVLLYIIAAVVISKDDGIIEGKYYEES